MKKTLLTSSLVALGVSQLAFTGEEMAPVVDTSAPSSSPWTLGIEALYLKAHHSVGEFDDYSSQDHEFGYRLEAAYKDGDNLGIRLRFFDFEGTDGINNDASSAFYADSIQAIDLEVFDNFELGAFNGEYAFGIRQFSYSEQYEGSDYVDFVGYGPTFALELVRPINDAISVYANTRVALVFGDDDVNNDDNTALITEIGLGLQYDFGDCGSNVRLGVEAQHFSGVSNDSSEDASLFGGVLGLNFSF